MLWLVLLLLLSLSLPLLEKSSQMETVPSNEAAANILRTFGGVGANAIDLMVRIPPRKVATSDHRSTCWLYFQRRMHGSGVPCDEASNIPSFEKAQHQAFE
mmetsp:Transcript_12003/g.17072  ORF Transcript_12003/g.17072 Transcript_12003/m.17072 type:complete len:101 (-) Transcript_12003:1068-1370(-)